MLVFANGQVSTSELRAPEAGENVFVSLVRPSEEDVHRIVGQLFGCHPLVVEDCLEWDQRPHLDQYDDHLYLPFYVLKNHFKLYEMSVVMGQHFLLVFFAEPVPFMEELESELTRLSPRMVSSGMMLYAMLNACVQHYADLVDTVEQRVDELENQIYENPHAKLGPRIFNLKRRLHKVRRIFSQERDVLTTLMHARLLAEEDVRYLADIVQQVSQAVEMVDAFRDALTGLLEMQMSLKGDKMNEIMKTLTIVNTIFLPMMFVVGLYGTNIHLPEYNWAKNYLWLWGWLAISSILMFIIMKRKKWI